MRNWSRRQRAGTATGVFYLDWRAMLDDDRIQIVNNCGPHSLHTEPSIAALEAGKHVLCEKPMALNASDGRACCSPRESPAVSTCAASTTGSSRGAAGARGHRARTPRDDLPLPWPLPPGERARPRAATRQGAGSAAPWVGSLLNLGSHLVDMARFLVGEPVSASALVSTFEPTRSLASGERIAVEADDAFLALLQFDNGSIGVLEASRVATGRKNRQYWEVNGSKGSLCFDLERLNELQACLEFGAAESLTGFQNVLVTEAQHPYLKFWWPRGHILGGSTRT